MIDVIIPAYNAHNLIMRTLHSIIMQQIKDKFNVYIVNDCSSHDYSEEIEKVKKYINIKELKTPENLGPGGARQFGIDNSDGEYITFIDADDVFNTTFAVRALYDFIDGYNYNAVTSDFIKERDGVEVIGFNTFWMHGKMFRRSFLEENYIRFNNTRANEDTGFNTLVNIICPFEYLIERTYIYSENSESITRKNDFEYRITGKEGYVNNIIWAVNEANDRCVPRNKICGILFHTLYDMYYEYLEYYNNREDILKWTKKLYEKYVMYRSYNLDEERIPIMRSIVKELSDKLSYNCLIYSNISFNDFLKMLDDECKKPEMVDKVILCNPGRYQRDFEYLFPNIEVECYLSEERGYLEDKKIITYTDLSLNNDIKIIICDRKNKKYNELFNSVNYVEGINYCYFEDYGKVLDEKDLFEELDEVESMFEDYTYHPKISNSDMLKEMIYTNSRYEFNCLQVNEYVQIQTFGYVYPCCSGWTKYPIGNLFLKDPDEIWNDIPARLYRLSIYNKTYTYCYAGECPLLPKETVPEEKTIWYTNKEAEKPINVCLAYDYTCNLHCKSCRKGQLNYNNNKQYQALYSILVRKLMDAKWLESDKLYIASQGEALLGKSYRDILFSKENNRKQIILHTNGNLLNKQNLDKLVEKYDDITIFISIDAATKETYESLRLGGNFDVLMENLEYLSSVKKDLKKKKSKKSIVVSLLFVVQRDNYKELPDACKMVIDLGFDTFDVTRIVDWKTYDPDEFGEISMYNADGSEKTELLEVLKNPIFKTDKINITGNVIIK